MRFFNFIRRKVAKYLYTCVVFRDTAKALSCVASIEQLAQPTAESVAHTILYAKYCIFLRDKDQQAAEGALWALLKLALTPFAMALNAVKALSTEALSGQVDAVPFYKYLAGKYPK